MLGRGGRRPTRLAAAPIDVTGYWASIVGEDWRYRVTTAPKGDYAGVPLNGAGRQAADAWDAARDRAAGEQWMTAITVTRSGRRATRLAAGDAGRERS